MDIGKSFDAFARTVTEIAQDFISGDCIKNARRMSQERQLETAVKVALLALAAGVVFGLVCGITGITGGILGGIFFAAVVGIGAFAYYTSTNQYDVSEEVRDHAKSVYNKFDKEIRKNF